MKFKLLITSVFFFFGYFGISAQSDDFAKLPSKFYLTLGVAKQIATNAEQEAVKNKWNVSIAIVNEAGQLLYFLRMDDSPNSSVDVAIAKAKHSANYRRDTKFHQELITKGNNVVLTLPDSMPIEGGLQLVYEGKVIGAIGVSGVTSENDGRIAKAGADFIGKQK